MNPKLQKVITEIEKTRARITEAQARLRELEAQRTDLENTEIVTLFRSINVPPAELAGFIRAYKTQGTPTAAPAPATYNTPEQEVTDHDED